MDVAVVEAKQEEAARAVFRAVSRSARGPWVRVRVFWSEIAGASHTFLEIWDAEGARSSIPVPGDVDAPMRELRRETERPGEGAWLSAFLTVTAEGRYTFEYNHDRRPSWSDARDPLAGHRDDVHPDGWPSDAALVADLERHPRRPEALPAWYPVALPAVEPRPDVAEPERAAGTLAPPPSVADVVALPGWAGMWESVVSHLDRALRPEVARLLASTPQRDRVQETDDVVGAAWTAVWAERVLSLDAVGVVGLWEPWARATGRDPSRGAAVDPRSDVGAHLVPGSPLDLVLQDLGDVVDTVIEAALDARLAAVDRSVDEPEPEPDSDVDVDVRDLVVALAERGRLRVVEQPGTELAVGNGDTGFRVTVSGTGFDVESTERGRGRVRATAGTLDLALRVLLWELRVPVRAVLGLERIAVGDDLASVPAGVHVEESAFAVTVSWHSDAGDERVSFPGSDARRAAVGAAHVLELAPDDIVSLVLDPDAPRRLGSVLPATGSRARGGQPERPEPGTTIPSVPAARARPLPHGGWGPPPTVGQGPVEPGGVPPVVAPVPVVQLGPGERWPGVVVAGVGRRIAALAIDVVLAVAVLYGTLFAAVLAVPDPAVEAWAVPTAFFSAELAWLAGLGVAVGLLGRTPGMSLLGLRVVHDTDPRRTVGVGRALLRGLVVFPLGLAWIWLLLLLLSATSLDPSGRRRGWHDRAARSQVIDVRRGADPVADPSWRPPVDRPVLVRLA